jgi:hypothetical protein
LEPCEGPEIKAVEQAPADFPVADSVDLGTSSPDGAAIDQYRFQGIQGNSAAAHSNQGMASEFEGKVFR